MRNTIILTIVLFVAVVGASIFYFSDLNGEHQEAAKPLRFLPKETLFLASFSNDQTTDNIFQDYEVFEALVGTTQLQEMAQYQKDLLRHPSIHSLAEGADIYLSAHVVGEKTDFLYTIPLLSSIDKEALPQLLKDVSTGYTLSQKDTLKTTIYTFKRDSSTTALQVMLHKNIFFASPAQDILLEILDDQKPKINDEQIDSFVKSNSRNTPFRIFLAHDQLTTVSQHYLRSKPGAMLEQFIGLGGHSNWNMNYKNDALILSGESYLGSRSSSYLALFADQQKRTQQLYTYFPEATAVYTEYTLSDKALFQRNVQYLLKDREEWQQIDKSIKNKNPSDSLKLWNTLQTTLGDGFAVVEQSNETSLGFIQLADSINLAQQAETFADKVVDSIYRFNHSHSLYALYGDALKIFPRPYFIQVDQIIVLANSLSVLQEYRRHIQQGMLLNSTLGFKNFEKTQGIEANITSFVRTKTARSLISNKLKRPYAQQFTDSDNYGYQDFYSWSIQLSGNKGSFLSSIYGIYKSKNALGQTPEWTYSFDHRPITQPWVLEHSDTSKFILIQEQNHAVHGIHPKGQKMWSSVFSGRIVGQVQQLSDRTIVLVTDRNRLYRITSDGKPVAGFSVALPERPSYSPTIASWNNQQYIIIPTGNTIQVYDLEGRAVEGWKDIRLEGTINYDVKVVGTNLYVATDKGQFYQFNSAGQQQAQQTLPQAALLQNPIAVYTDASSNKTTLLAVDSSGTVSHINFQTAIYQESKNFGSSNFMALFVGDGAAQKPPMVVLSDRKALFFTNADSVQSRSYAFSQQLEDRPQLFSENGSEQLIGVASASNSLIYILNMNATLLEGFPVAALPQFYYGKIDYNSTNYLLCVRRDKKLYAFKN